MPKTKNIEAVAEETTMSEVLPLHTALNLNQQFSSEALRTGGGTRPRWLTWATGNSEAFEMNGKTALPAARGWIIDQPNEDEGMYPDDYELLDAMESLVERGFAKPCMVVHQDKETKKPKKVPSWSLPTPGLFVVCEGVPSQPEMSSDPSCRWGVAYGWRPGDGLKGPRSELTFYAFVQELMSVGYHGIFQVSFNSHCTDKALQCLKAQEYVLNFADGLRTEAGTTTASPFYAYSLPIKCSDTTLTAGREPGKSKEVYYPVPAISRLSRRYLSESVAYLDLHAISPEHAAIVEQGGRVEQLVEWSIEKSKRIAAGKDVPADGGEDVPFPSDDDAPAASYPSPF